MFRRAVIGLFFASMLLIAVASAQLEVSSVPMYRGDAERSGVMPGPGPNATMPVGEHWRVAFGDATPEPGRGMADAPVMADGIVYVSAGEHLLALDAASGQEIWRSKRVTQIATSPAVVDGVVFFQTNDIPNDELVALDARTGVERWRFTLEWGPGFSAPAVANGIVYITAGWMFDDQIYAIDATTGQEIWSKSPDGNLLSSPAVANGVLYIGTWDMAVHALDAATGEERWVFQTDTSMFFSTLAVAAGLVFIGGLDGTVYALDAVTGAERWRLRIGATVTSAPAVRDDVIYIAGLEGSVFALDAATGLERWRFAAAGPVWSDVVLADGVVYVGSDDGNLYALDAASGTERWRFATWAPVRSSPAIVGGMIYLASTNGNIYALGEWLASPVTRPSTLEPGVIATVAVSGADLRGAPAPTGVVRDVMDVGDHVLLTGTSVNGWWPVQTADGMTGWLYEEVLAPQP